MKTGKIIGAVIFVISCMALWFLLMPPTLYGILGCVVVLAVACLLVHRQGSPWKKGRRDFHVVYILPVGMFCWVAAQKFYERWLPSGAVASLAGVLGTESGTLLLAADALATVVALPVLFAAAGWLGRLSEKLKFKTLGQESGTERDKAVLGQKISGMDLLFFLLLSLCVGMQLALNPWSNGYPGSDSTVFLYIGERMREGAVPYRDLFDHKGLLLYFIEYLGLCIGNGSFVGVWLLEVVNLFATALLFFKITQLFSRKRTVCYTVVSLVLCTVECYIVYEGGNLTEEYALPWIALALYIFLKYFIEGSYRFCEIMLLGVSFVAVLFLRGNMVAVWAAFLPVVLIGMIARKEWRDIGRCMAGFLTGTLMGLVPFVVYCLTTGSLGDMLRYYIGFNFGYSDSEGGILPLLSTAWFLFRQTAVWIAVLLATAWIFRKNRIWRLNLWFLGVTLVLASMSGRLYYHYGMILLPAMLVPSVLLLEKAGERIKDGTERYLIGIAGVFLVLQAVVSLVSYTGPAQSEIAAYIEEHTEETDEILVLGNDCRYYLETGRCASDKFFYQTPPINVSDALYEEFLEGFQTERPAVIVVIGDKDSMKKAGDNLAGICGLLEEWEAEGLYSYTPGDSYGIYCRMER